MKDKQKKIFFDTSFFIRLYKTDDPDHKNAKTYWRRFRENDCAFFLSTIVAAEFGTGGAIKKLPYKYVTVLPFNLNHAERAAALAMVAFENKRKGVVALENRVVIPNDTKILAQAEEINVDLAAVHGRQPCAGTSILHLRQPLYDADRLHAQADDGQEQIQDVAGIADLCSPVVGVIADARLLVGAEGIALHDPLDGRLAIDDIVVGAGRDVVDGDVAVVENAGLVGLGGEAHFLYAKMAALSARYDQPQGLRRGLLLKIVIVQVQGSQGAAGF